MNREWATIAGRLLTSIEVSNDRYDLLMQLVDGSKWISKTEADCCSQSWIEHLEVYATLPAVVLAVEDAHMGSADTPDGNLLQSYRTVITTSTGDIVVEYRNESNGYYGGSLSGPYRVAP